MARFQVLFGVLAAVIVVVPTLTDGATFDGQPRSRTDSDAVRLSAPRVIDVPAPPGAPERPGVKSEHTCPSGYEERERFAYYDVRGEDRALAKQSFETNRPRTVRFDGAPMRAAGLTNWRIGYRYCRRDFGSHCQLTTVLVVLEIDYLMPRWVDRERAEGIDGERWDTFYQRLLDHEKGHAVIARSGAQDLLRQLAGMAMRRTCAGLEDEISERAAALIEDVKQRQIAFDRDTNHGATQGVGYPFR